MKTVTLKNGTSYEIEENRPDIRLLDVFSGKEVCNDLILENGLELLRLQADRSYFNIAKEGEDSYSYYVEDYIHYNIAGFILENEDQLTLIPND